MEVSTQRNPTLSGIYSSRHTLSNLLSRVDIQNDLGDLVRAVYPPSYQPKSVVSPDVLFKRS